MAKLTTNLELPSTTTGATPAKTAKGRIRELEAASVKQVKATEDALAELEKNEEEREEREKHLQEIEKEHEALKEELQEIGAANIKHQDLLKKRADDINRLICQRAELEKSNERKDFLLKEKTEEADQHLVRGAQLTTECHELRSGNETILEDHKTACAQIEQQAERIAELERVPLSNLHSKVAEIMVALEELRTTYSQALGFAFVTDSALMSALRPIMGQAGLEYDMQPLELTERTRTRHKDGKEYKDSLLRLNCLCSLIDTDTGERNEPAQITVESYDTGDKTIESLYTKAKKVYLVNKFLVSSEAMEGEEITAHPLPETKTYKAKTSPETVALKKRIWTVKNDGKTWDEITAMAKKIGYTGDKVLDAPDHIMSAVLAGFNKE